MNLFKFEYWTCQPRQIPSGWECWLQLGEVLDFELLVLFENKLEIVTLIHLLLSMDSEDKTEYEKAREGL